MSRLLTVAAAVALLAGCDSTGGPEPLADPGPGAFVLAVEDSDSGAVTYADGQTDYAVRDDLPRDAGYNTALLTLRSDASTVESQIALYVSQDGSEVFPPPGVYDVSRFSGAPFGIRFEIGGRLHTAYLGTLTVETASETAFVGSFDVEATTGGCGLLPTCEGPTLTASVTGRFHAETAP